jgi:hypothetical protein
MQQILEKQMTIVLMRKETVNNMPTKKKYATSKYYGLTKEVGCNNRWVVQFHLQGKMYYVGTFADEESAVIAREEYIDKHFPNANIKRNILERTVETTNSPLNA